MPSPTIVTSSIFCQWLANDKTILKEKLIIFPTDTLWGIGCLADDKLAIEKIYHIKQRPRHKPLIILLSHKSCLANITNLTPEIKKIIDRFFLCHDDFIGGLSIILPQYSIAKWQMATTQPDDSVCFRIPHHATAKKILSTIEHHCQMALAVTSINLTDHTPATNQTMAKTFYQTLSWAQKKDIFFINQDEKCQQQPSTILSLLNNPPKIIRPGILPTALIEKKLRIKIQQN
ncbi:MAG: L-threonylcarbamoyladenylate synthase [Alphaproteobacteria bacterium]